MVRARDIDDITRQSLLYDFYGQLLTERQRSVFELYHGENLSLAEIAEEFGISRQGVHDALRSAQKSLNGYEETLGLLERFLKTESAVKEIDEEILEMIDLLEEQQAADAAVRQEAGGRAAADLIPRLRRIQSIIDRLEE